MVLLEDNFMVNSIILSTHSESEINPATNINTAAGYVEHVVH